MVFDANSPYKGKVTAYDSPIYIADAAVYLMATQPDLGIKNPYALDQKQFDAAVELLTGQKALVGVYWSAYTDAQKALESGTHGRRLDLADHREPGQGRQGTGRVGAAQGGRDRLVGHLDGRRQGHQHPNCAYKWMNWITSPTVQAQVAEWFGEAPANTKACDLTTDKTHCDTYHADGRGLLQADLVLDHAAEPTASTGAPTSSACRTRSGRRRGAACATADPSRLSVQHPDRSDGPRPRHA